ncbi:dynamin family protein [Thiohalomonas denitrificans]|uniref:dynamin family protein n=1 Tax=Thiohalomonas denitrificans TaxID=415747 RepID=UPI0026F34905|nr:dynamin family protein [Thiohalomonas denitrificans]
MRADPVIEKRLQSLESHLTHENPVLLSAVKSFRELDRVAYRMGLLKRTQSYATLIPWWPLISVLGTFSSGKSTFINYYLDYPLQLTGNQAVDDKFTVVCHGREGEVHTLPGLALDADPRFPFYQIGEEIDKVAEGEGRRIDAYLQLKTCPSEVLRGKILIDSPGFDADEQRTSILRITEHIVDLSDLVLVFFDARHPEPGAMHDTLEYLVADTIRRPDSSKFLYILNQIDTAAREDNPEEVFGAWQRALSQKGLTAGRFYTIYNPEAANPIDDESLQRRFESKRDRDLEEIRSRMEQVTIERAYRIVGALESKARDIEERVVPLLSEAIGRWRRLTLGLDAVLLLVVLTAFLVITIQAGYWEGLRFTAPWFQSLMENANLGIAVAVVLVALLAYLHHIMRNIAGRRVLKWLTAQAESSLDRASLAGAFRKSTRFWHRPFSQTPIGWGRRARKRIARVVADTDRFVQSLNDRFADPTGKPKGTAEDSKSGSVATVRSDSEIQ